MVIKSLTITEEAYNSLKRKKMNEESFSEVIIRVTNEKKGESASFFGCLKESAESLDNLQNKIKRYRNEYSKDSEKRIKALKEQIK